MAARTFRFPFLGRQREFSAAGALPYMPIILSRQKNTLNTMGLLDTGASVNVLPYGLGEQLGAVWDERAAPVLLTGNLAGFEARALVVSAIVGSFESVPLVFAWTRAERVPLILGQINFFIEFDVCFFRRRGIVEVRLAQS